MRVILVALTLIALGCTREDGGDAAESSGTCGQVDPCPLTPMESCFAELTGATGACGEPGQTGDWPCVLGALRDRTPGQYRLELGLLGVCGGHRDQIQILSDGTAQFQRTNFPGGFDAPQTEDPWRRVEIRPSGFFDACVGSTDLDAIAACALDWSVLDSCVDAELPPC